MIKTSHVDSMYIYWHLLWYDENDILPVVFLSKIHSPSLIIREMPDKNQFREILYTIQPLFFKSVKTVKKESMRYCYSQVVSKETWKLM